jgi:hypothetical protein
MLCAVTGRVQRAGHRPVDCRDAPATAVPNGKSCSVGSFSIFAVILSLTVRTYVMLDARRYNVRHVALLRRSPNPATRRFAQARAAAFMTRCDNL